VRKYQVYKLIFTIQFDIIMNPITHLSTNQQPIMKKIKFLQVFCIIAFSCGISFSQENVAYPTRVIMPQALWSYGNEISSELPISVGPFDNYVISPTSGFLETDICVNPANPNNFVATDNRITGFVGPTYVYYTTDGGVTWTATNQGISGNQGDPAFTCDAAGNFYLAVLNSGVLIYKSTNGGATWTNLGLGVSNGNADKEWIAADQTTGTYQNNVYFAYVNFSTGASVDFHRSTNNGTSWSFVGNMGSGTPNPGPDVAVDPDGRVVLAWYGGGGTTIRMSNDGGASFAAQVTASAHSTPGVSNCSGRNVLKDINNSYGFRVNGMPHIAIDMTSGSRRGYIYNVYATNPPGPDNADVYVTRSTDHGATWNWTTPVRVNDDVGLTDQCMCDASVDNQGRLWVMWWDSRDDAANNALIWTYAAVSTNGGTSFLPNFAVSSQSFNYLSVRIVQGTCHYYMGDYQGMSGKGITFPCYTGQGNSRQDFTAYLPDYGMSFSKDLDSISQGSSSPNRVRAPLMGPYSGSVTYTASVSPPPSSGTITFGWVPSNVLTINGVPDSITLNTTVSATVPIQAYTVSVTGTESSGPRTHTRSWSLIVRAPIGILNNQQGIPKEYKLGQNFPNPFNPTTTINFGLPKASLVTMKIYDILGNEVLNVVNEYVRAGNYSVTVDASNLPSGVYFYKINAGEFTDVKKLMLLK
jgi:type IX secretion system substrate protein/BNR/Asp-box repeat protein